MHRSDHDHAFASRHSHIPEMMEYCPGGMVFTRVTGSESSEGLWARVTTKVTERSTAPTLPLGADGRP